MNANVDTTMVAICMLAPMLIVAMLYAGCSTRGELRLKRYDVNCTSCKVKMQYDISQEDKELNIKGLQQ